MRYATFWFLVGTLVVQQLPCAAQSARRFDPPRPLTKIEPSFSQEAVLTELQGTVLLSVLVGQDGTVQSTRVMRSLGLGLDEKAIEAVRLWRFQPGSMNGNSVAAPVTVAVDFRSRSAERFWHSIGQHFAVSEGVSRPVVESVVYPINGPAENANLTVAFEVDQVGIPQNIRVLSSSAPDFDSEITEALRVWRFRPGGKAGVPVTIGCTLNLVWSTGRRLRSYRDNLTISEAVQAADADSVVVLLMKGDNPNIVGDGGSPLHEAALKGDSGMVKVLLEYGADVNALSKDGRLPLHDAALGGNAEALNALISSGADVTAQTRRERQTALHIAPAWGRIEVIKLLISAKAPTSIKDAAGRTPLEEAVTNAQAEAVAVLQQVVH